MQLFASSFVYNTHVCNDRHGSTSGAFLCRGVRTGRRLAAHVRLEGAVAQLCGLALRPLRRAPLPQRPPRYRQLLEPRSAFRLLQLAEAFLGPCARRALL